MRHFIITISFIIITSPILLGQPPLQPDGKDLESKLKESMFDIATQKIIPDYIIDRFHVSVECIDKNRLNAYSDSIKYYYYIMSAIGCDLELQERLELVDKAIKLRENSIGINDEEYPFCLFIKEKCLKALQAPIDERIRLLEDAIVICSNRHNTYNNVDIFDLTQYLDNSFLTTLIELYEEQGYYKASLWVYLKYFTLFIMWNENFVDYEEPIRLLKKSFTLLPLIEDKKSVNQYFDQLMNLFDDYKLKDSKLFNLLYGEIAYVNGPSDESIIALGRVKDWLKRHDQYDIDLGDIYSKLYESYKNLGYDDKAEALIPEMSSYFETLNSIEENESIIEE